MTTRSIAAILAASFCALACAAPAPTPFFARQEAPLDGWAAQDGGTRGGAHAPAANIVTVATPAQLRAALARKDKGSRIVAVKGLIDMSEGRPYTSTADQAERGEVRLPGNTTLIGLGPDAGFVNAHVMVAKVSQVVIRNLHFRNPCDVAPTWDPKDGASGNWNAEFDGISIVGATHVWVDHNSFTDAPFTDDQQAFENGKHKQCHDGALDIRDGADFVTVSYNRFALHQKNMLIGASDKAPGDSGHLRVTLSNNLFENIASRAPRVRFGQVHLFNNYHVGDRKHPVYKYEYGVGVAKQARIVSQANAFEIAGARSCLDAIKPFETDAPDAGVFTDTGSLLNGRTIAPCGQASSPAWVVPYPFTPRPAEAVAAHVLANAGAGKMVQPASVAACPTADFLACDGFERGARSQWEVVEGSPAALAVYTDAAGANRVLRVDGPGRLLTLTKHAGMTAAGARHAFLEARLRSSGAAPARQLFLVGRYVDPRNWVGAGIDFPGRGDTMLIQLVKMQDGVLTRLKSVPRARLPDARFATLRLDMAPAMLAVYLDGEKITTAPQPEFTATGTRAGLLAQGGLFELDDMRAGVPAVQPARIAPSLAGPDFTAQAGDPPQLLGVSAVDSDGVTRLPYAARALDPAVASVAVTAGGITITPKAPGTTRIVLSSVADPALQSTINVAVGAPFAVSTGAAPPGALVSPAAGARDVPVDTLLRMTFERVPVLGSAGSVRILRKADQALVDIVRLGDEVRAIGYPGQPRSRYVRFTPITVEGNTVSIQPHSGTLAYGEEYEVLVGEGVLREGGVGAAWTFRTAAGAPQGTTLTVDDDGAADFRTVQGALNHAMRSFAKATPVTVDIRNGRYRELLFVLGKDQLTLRGEGRDGVVIHATNNDGLNPGSGGSQGPGSPSFSGGRSLMAVEEADLLTLENLTLRNTTLRGNTRSGQAETVYFNSDGGRLVAKNANFFSEQDTIQVKGYAWFWRTLIEGNVDFIWGANRAALFEESELRSVGDSGNPASGGYVVQARTVSATDPGFVFLNSTLTHGAGPKGNGVPAGSTWLARSPGTASTWDNVAYINCRMGEHVAPGGWAGAGVNKEPAPNPAIAAAAQGWREFGSMDLAGKPLDVSRRAGGYALTAEEVRARLGSRKVIFSGFNGGVGWDPLP
jgi:pectate lyase/pectin methylesterase-like acyl-CoA thioesterase